MNRSPLPMAQVWKHQRVPASPGHAARAPAGARSPPVAANTVPLHGAPSPGGQLQMESRSLADFTQGVLYIYTLFLLDYTLLEIEQHFLFPPAFTIPVH